MEITKEEYRAATIDLQNVQQKAARHNLEELRARAERIDLLLRDAAGIERYVSSYTLEDIPAELQKLKHQIRDLRVTDLDPVDLSHVDAIVLNDGEN